MLESYQIVKSMSELDEEKLYHYIRETLKGENGVKNAKKIILYCQKGMREVGELFEKGEYFIGDLIFAGELMKDVVDNLKPFINKYTWKSSGKIVLGTVEGDLHDIGKNIFKSMAIAAGFNVYDLGINQSEKRFVNAVKDIKPDIIGLSGVLTTAVESMSRTIKLVGENVDRECVNIVIGGSCVSKKVRDYTGADDYTLNAAAGIEKCIQWMNNEKIAV